MTRELHLVVPDSVDDPRRPSGGNVYDHELAAALRADGVVVHEHRVAHPSVPPGHGVATVLCQVPDGATVLVDGLLGLAAPHPLRAEQHRLCTALLVHLPFSLAHSDPLVERQEALALAAASMVVATSGWTRDWLVAHHGLSPGRVHVAAPGVRRAALTRPVVGGGRLLSVGTVTRPKGQDVLVEALTGLSDHRWTCRITGRLDIDPAYVDEVGAEVHRGGLDGQVRLTGPATRLGMATAYAATDLLVVPSRLETYGMAVTEALARGIPVVAADTGGVTEALGSTAHGLPGLLVPPDDPAALRDALAGWFSDARLREALRMAARARRAVLSDWSVTAAAVRAALDAAWDSCPGARSPGVPA